MKRQTFVAGVISAVLIACGGPAARLAGGAMRDAGEVLTDAGIVDAGEMLRDAGAALEDAARPASMREREVDAGRDAGVSDAQAQNAPAGGPYWVLQDKASKTIPAVISPLIKPDAQRFVEAQPDCVYVEYMDQRERHLQYDLTSGKLGCYPPGKNTWHETSAVYLTSACSDPQYALAPSLAPIAVANTWYYAYGDPDVTVTGYYQWNGTACTQVTPAASTDLWLYYPVPTEVLTLKGAPYTMALVYP